MSKGVFVLARRCEAFRPQYMIDPGGGEIRLKVVDIVHAFHIVP
jgi:hypothetical protein